MKRSASHHAGVRLGVSIALGLLVGFWVHQRMGHLPQGPSWIEAPQPSAAAPAEALPIETPPALADGTWRGGLVRFGGRPLHETTRAPMHFWFRNDRTNTVPKPDVRYDRATSRYRLRGLEAGPHYVDIRVDARPGNPTLYAGDLGGGRTVRDEEPSWDIDLMEVIHVVEPFDNGGRIDYSSSPDLLTGLPVHRSPVMLRWEPLEHLGPEGLSYGWSIDQVTPKPWYSTRVKAGGSLGTQAEIELPPSPPGTFYMLRMEATRDRHRVGYLTLHGQNYLAWDYRFLVDVE